ncbi:MAG: GTP-binding protein [Coleofasciculus sp. G3-WIS-01]|uniref:GTP-binding protein n=1 Tax=Coleofasciculus sp. G3-WIS-01 TaxID=3069528 RepID=UPI0033039B65
MIIAVAGLPGAGKTTWIRQQLAIADQPVLYFSPGSQPVPIDITGITVEFPQVTLLKEGDEYRLLDLARLECLAYMELGFHLDLESVEPVLSVLDHLCYRRVAVMPPNVQDTGWHVWADQVVPGVKIATPEGNPELWRAPISGQVIDPASLDVFWAELTQGAYGNVNRAKGIFDLADGRAFYFDFVAGINRTYTELALPRWLEGRPQRFSGIEVVGVALDKSAIAQTLKDCCLSDVAVHHYQQQIKESLAILDPDEEEVV